MAHGRGGGGGVGDGGSVSRPGIWPPGCGGVGAGGAGIGTDTAVQYIVGERGFAGGGAKVGIAGVCVRVEFGLRRGWQD
jgi:hypothetical protein